MIQFGNEKIGEIYVGSDKIKEVYYGSDLVWSGFKPSFLILTDNTKIEFALDNTPINNFGTTGNNTTSLTINGQSIVKNTIKEAHLGDSYNEVTSIGDHFLRNCTYLTSVDLSGLSNLTSINRYFLYACSSLTSLDLSPLSNLTNIGTYFLQNCSSLTTLKIDAETPPTLGSSAFRNSNNLSLILVPCGSESAYKSVTNWRAKSSIIQEDCSLTPSYIILTNGTRIDFGLSNTPLHELSTIDHETTSITVNGQSVVKNTIKEIYFGGSYKGVTRIGGEFLYNCTGLISIDLSGLNNATSIGNSFISSCSSLTSLDLSPLSNITSIESSFLQNCPSLTTLIMGAETPPTLGSAAFSGTDNLSLILVPCGSENAYKSATNWIAKADIIQGDC